MKKMVKKRGQFSFCLPPNIQLSSSLVAGVSSEYRKEFRENLRAKKFKDNKEGGGVVFWFELEEVELGVEFELGSGVELESRVLVVTLEVIELEEFEISWVLLEDARWTSKDIWSIEETLSSCLK